MFALSGKSRDVMCSLGDLMYMRTCVLVLIYRAHFVGITAAFRPGLDCKKVCVCVCMCVCVCVPTFVFSSSHLLISVDDACARLAIPNQQHSVDERDARLARTYRGCGKCAPNANVMRLETRMPAIVHQRTPGDRLHLPTSRLCCTRTLASFGT